MAVAGSVGPTGELFEPMGALTSALAEEVFEEQAQALAAGGADMLQIETMSSVEEVEAAVTACRKTGLPVMATMSFDSLADSRGKQLAAETLLHLALLDGNLLSLLTWVNACLSCLKNYTKGGEPCLALECCHHAITTMRSKLVSGVCVS